MTNAPTVIPAFASRHLRRRHDGGFLPLRHVIPRQHGDPHHQRGPRHQLRRLQPRSRRARSSGQRFTTYAAQAQPCSTSSASTVIGSRSVWPMRIAGHLAVFTTKPSTKSSVVTCSRNGRILLTLGQKGERRTPTIFPANMRLFAADLVL